MEELRQKRFSRFVNTYWHLYSRAQISGPKPAIICVSRSRRYTVIKLKFNKVYLQTNVTLSVRCNNTYTILYFFNTITFFIFHWLYTNLKLCSWQHLRSFAVKLRNIYDATFCSQFLEGNNIIISNWLPENPENVWAWLHSKM